MNQLIYLDYAANTPVLPEVLSTYVSISSQIIANPNASHALGLQANIILEQVSSNIASILGVKANELIYTSGATEANNLAIKGVAYGRRQYGKHIISSYLEHASITGSLMALQEEGFEIDFVDINSDGSINTEHLQELLRNDTILVSIAAVDSEMGCRQNLKELYDIIHTAPFCLLHTDATQAIGKISVGAENYDLMTCSAHKFHGLNGVGLLVCKESIVLHPLIHGGISTTPYRSGTPVVGMVCAMHTALFLASQDMKSHYDAVQQLNNALRNALTKYPSIIINSPTSASPYILNISLRGMKGEAVQDALGKQNIFVSTKAACCAVNTPSKPVYAMTKDRKRALSTLRISLSHMTTMEEINSFLIVFDNIVKETR